MRMAPLRLCLTALALALVTARTSVTVSWNVRSAPAPQAAAPPAGPPQSGVVAAVRGTRVILRMRDGTLHVFSASSAQAAELHKLVGTVVHFRSTP